MGYASYLRELLAPLGVYRLEEKSFSGAELEALGGAMDALWSTAEAAQRETIAATAGGEGLSRMEAIFPFVPAAADTAARRAAIGAFLTISGDSFTPAALSRSLAACGVTGRVEETDIPGTVAVSFPGVMGEPDGFARVRRIIETILPCHLLIRYDLRWCLWSELNGLSWADVSGLSWEKAKTYHA